METCKARLWRPWASEFHLHTSPILENNCHKCISEHRSVETAVTSSRGGYDNAAVASLHWGWSFQVQKHRDHSEAKVTEQRQGQTEESSTTNSPNPLQTHTRQSQSGATHGNCLNYDFTLDCQTIQGINTGVFSLYLSPNFSFPFFLAFKHLADQETQ